MPVPYDALLLVSFGGPERPSDVMPFLENVVRGRNVPRQRILQVAQRYELFGGVSPINAQNRALLAALVNELDSHGLSLPVYWGNRNWHPLLAEAIGQMAEDGVRRALAFVTSTFSSYPGCRQYLEDIQRAQHEVGPAAPEVHKLRVFYNHPGFIEPMRHRVQSALAEIPAERRPAAQIIYTAHSIPLSMAVNCAYEKQLQEACRLVSEGVGRAEWQLAYQSRSGPPAEPWLGPDLCDCLRQLGPAAAGADVVIVPIGFVCENIETVYDLDVEARNVCDELGLSMVRAAVVGCHPRLVEMIRQLVQERLDDRVARLALGNHGPSHDLCPPDCCPPQ